MMGNRVRYDGIGYPKNFEKFRLEVSVKNRLLKHLSYLIVGPLKIFWVSILKAIGGVGFLAKAFFLIRLCYQFLAHGCKNWDIDLKFKMGGRMDTILMFVKFSEHPISSYRVSQHTCLWDFLPNSEKIVNTG